jgi:hypothetical protein
VQLRLITWARRRPATDALFVVCVVAGCISRQFNATCNVSVERTTARQWCWRKILDLWYSRQNGNLFWREIIDHTSRWAYKLRSDTKQHPSISFATESEWNLPHNEGSKTRTSQHKTMGLSTVYLIIIIKQMDEKQ